MIYYIILAGGSGLRMKNSKPKQFLEVNNKPILIYTIEQFLLLNHPAKIIIPCNNEWIDYCKELINNHFKDNDFKVIGGGTSRNSSIKCAIEYLKNNYDIHQDDLIITHDGVRMFVSSRIIKDHIDALSKDNNYVYDTCISSNDTIAQVKNNNVVNILDRQESYCVQTPQSCSFKTIDDLYKDTEAYDSNLYNSCDLCTLAEIKKYQIKVIQGEYVNFKITSSFDLTLAELLIKDNIKKK